MTEITLVFYLMVLAGILLFYMIPTIIAFSRNHPHRIAILIVNVLFGAVGIGWIGALIWALISPRTMDYAMPIVLVQPAQRVEPRL